MAEVYNGKVMLADGTVLMDLTGDDVTESDVASGKTFHKRDGSPAIGTNTKDADTSDGTVIAAEVLDGEIAYSDGQRIVGTMPNRGAQQIKIADKNTPVAIQNGFHDGSGNATIADAEKAKLIPENIRQGITILGVEGEMSGSEDIQAVALAATPYLTPQTIYPRDKGNYNYFSQVSIAAIPITYTDNAAGGKTVTIGAVAPA